VNVYTVLAQELIDVRALTDKGDLIRDAERAREVFQRTSLGSVTDQGEGVPMSVASSGCQDVQQVTVILSVSEGAHADAITRRLAGRVRIEVTKEVRDDRAGDIASSGYDCLNVLTHEVGHEQQAVELRKHYRLERPDASFCASAGRYHPIVHELLGLRLVEVDHQDNRDPGFTPGSEGRICGTGVLGIEHGRLLDAHSASER